MSKKVVAIIQARMGSRRLPGKVLKPIAGTPMLALVVDRARLAETIDQVVVATTTAGEDDQVVALCEARGIPHIRGHPTDVLKRYLQAARIFEAEVIVRLTADCPLIDPQVIDRTVSAFENSAPPADYASNRLVYTYPIGLDTEVFSRAVLELADRRAQADYHREHVTPYLYEDPDRFRIVGVESGGDYGQLRWTVDTPEDLEFIRQVYSRFEGRDDFSWREVLALLEREPALIDINARIHHKTYRDTE